MSSFEDNERVSRASINISPSVNQEQTAHIADPSSTGLQQPVCHWRVLPGDPTSCSRYWDCPSHLVERTSTPAARNGQDEERTRRSPHMSGNLRWTNSSESRRSDILRRAASGSHASSPSSLQQQRQPPPLPSAARGTSQDHSRPGGSAVILPQGSASNPIVLADSPPQQGRASMLEAGGTANTPSNQGTPVRPSPGLYPGSSRPSTTFRFPGADTSVPSRPRISSGASFYQQRAIQQQALATPTFATSSGNPGRDAFTLPQWQPDEEVTHCPICGDPFGFMNRRHHCRKCGRVVCNKCSPHRITIPYQYIVRPPGTPRVYSPESVSPYGEGGFADFSSIGGGERVRLCNPCVPDPNISPPRTQGNSFSSSASGGHSRSVSSMTRPSASATSPFQFNPSSSDAPPRSRSVTMGHQASPASMFTTETSHRPIIPRHRLRSSRWSGLGQQSSDNTAEASGSAPSSSRMAIPAPQPRRQIPEEDECPVCHRELPARTLPDFESQREAHITSCIASHSAFSSTPSGAGAGTPPGAPSSAARRWRTGMFPYKATEKDCADDAECTICLEEFEVGVDMARLECLCKFHRRCIDAWFEGHPGQCPIHQHGEYGP